MLDDVDAFLAEESDSDEEGGKGSSEAKPLLSQLADPPQAPPQANAGVEEIPVRFEPKKKLQSEGKLKRGQVISESSAVLFAIVAADVLLVCGSFAPRLWNYAHV